MEWSFYKNNIYLEPLIFSNKKSQLDVAKEVIKAIKENHKVIFIKGVCGSGKSAIALNIAKEFKKASIVVPVKTLQNQYKEDYTNNFQVKKKDKNLKITVIDGRNNHKCPYKNTNCDDKELPCTIDIKEDNMPILKEYLEQNILLEEIRGIKDIRRKSIATACPYWSPLIPKEVKYNLDDAKEIEYDAINNKKIIYYKRKSGCSYYDQFDSYIDSDVIIFNSKKYELETVMDRKPETDIEIIDECDEFLDKLSAEKEINLNRLSLRISNIQNPKLKELVLEINDLILQIKYTEEILLIKDTKVLNLLNYFLKNMELLEDEEDYLFNIYETAKSFEKFFNETYISFKKNKYNELIVTVTTINLEKRLKEYLNKNKVFIMMSGTIHSENVLKNIFGIKDFKIIEAETKLKGNLIKKKTGLERTFNYEFLSQKGSRELYLQALSKSIELAKKPVLIHVNSFTDLPDEYEFLKYKLNIKTRERLMEEQNKYRKGELLQSFKNKEIDTLYSTKCSRGVDLPGDICNSIIFTKYPYPNIHSLFWKILKKSKPQHFGMFYFDKARRELVQRVYRGIRSENDEVNLLSPDIRVFDINS